ncbi:hypothetical protein DM01DRAFT_1411340 [Hesseltinella vesiculosa]|uniref:IPT/TIG domain-containing protein n=1 Tax=Hesseltinella vesiculosa TaxID=101127 RepID=A0A1X2G3Z3_9FUNG|nr:hypothetical protein DM01DRAFT_1411340 [Hesseltinella vesiculosa]
MTLVASHQRSSQSSKPEQDMDYLDPLFPELMTSLDDTTLPSSFIANDMLSPSSSANDSSSSTTTPSPASQYDLMHLEKQPLTASELDPTLSSLPDSYHQLTTEYYARSHLFPLPATSTSMLSSLVDDNLQIRVLGVPNIGAKSRVETQIKLCVQLLSSSGTKVHQWSYLRLDEDLLARSKLRKTQQQKQLDGRQPSMVSDESKVLSLSARVVCSTNPTKLVRMCTGCVRRERKRAERTKDGKPRYETEASGSVEEILEREKNRILVFNCTPMVNFSSGDAILPTRITCYCRHHNEKIGFRIEFVIRDHLGAVVANGSSPPIMITDDHKSSRQRGEPSPPCSTPIQGRKRGRSEDDLPPHLDFPSCSHSAIPDTPAPSRRGSVSSPGNSASIASSPSERDLTMEQPTPNSSLTSSPQTVLIGNDLLMTPMDELSFLQQMSEVTSGQQLQQQALPLHPTTPSAAMDDPSPGADQQLWPFSRRRRINGNDAATNNGYDHQPLWRTEYTPQLERLVPAQGPTYGGIEVTVLGSGFYRGLTCLFGEHAASTVYWNPNTLVCVLPPAATAGPVVVSFKEHPIVLEGQDVALFTYYDASDQALLELALQVVGMKMTGKLHDAKQIAMMIVRGDQQRTQQQGSQQQQSGQQQQQQQQQQQLSLACSADDDADDDLSLPSLDNTTSSASSLVDSDVSSVASDSDDDLSEIDSDTNLPLDHKRLEKNVIDALLASDAHDVTHTNPNGHTLLHLAVLLRYGALAKVLLDYMTPAVIDQEDRNGCTALQFACLQNNGPMVSLLLHAGASLDHDCSLGKTLDLPTDPAVHAILQQHRQPPALPRRLSFKSHVRRFYRLQTTPATAVPSDAHLDNDGLGFAQSKFDRRLYVFWLPLLIVTIGLLYYQILGDRTLMTLLQDIIPFRQRGLNSIVGY